MSSLMTEEPDFKLAGLSIWTMERQFPNLQDYWDGNWLRVRTVVEAPGCHLEAVGPYLRIDELAGFAEQLERVDAELRGEASLNCLEPTLRLNVRCELTGHVEVVVELTADHMAQSHSVRFGLDQTYLKAALRDCRSILQRFPIRGSR